MKMERKCPSFNEEGSAQGCLRPCPPPDGVGSPGLQSEPKPWAAEAGVGSVGPGEFTGEEHPYKEMFT